MTILIIFVPILVGILLLLNYLFSPKIYDAEKLTSYECGFLPFSSQTRAPFSIQYYLVGLMFLIFDLEIAIIYPIVTSLYFVGTYGIIVVIVFTIILTIGFIFEWSKGALKFVLNRPI